MTMRIAMTIVVATVIAIEDVEVRRKGSREQGGRGMEREPSSCSTVVVYDSFLSFDFSPYFTFVCLILGMLYYLYSGRVYWYAGLRSM